MRNHSGVVVACVVVPKLVRPVVKGHTPLPPAEPVIVIGEEPSTLKLVQVTVPEQVTEVVAVVPSRFGVPLLVQ
jgi:hypothetical protein